MRQPPHSFTLSLFPRGRGLQVGDGPLEPMGWRGVAWTNSWELWTRAVSTQTVRPPPPPGLGLPLSLHAQGWS